MLFPPVEVHWVCWEDGQICTLLSEALQKRVSASENLNIQPQILHSYTSRGQGAVDSLHGSLGVKART